MLVYIYNDSFEGLLTAIYESFYRREKPDRILTVKNLQASLVDRYVYIDTDTGKFCKVYDSIMEKISLDALQKVYNVFLSETPEVGTIVYEYLKLGWRVGSSVDNRIADDRVLKVHKISQKVECEKHKLLGFLRFRLVKGDIYYAPIGPVNNIVALLAPHFADRFSDMDWIIHDVKRDLAVVFNKKQWIMVDGVIDKVPDLDENEEVIESLWKEFFNSIAISNRINPKLQKNLMPIRYWPYMTEKW